MTSIQSYGGNPMKRRNWLKKKNRTTLKVILHQKNLRRNIDTTKHMRLRDF